MKILIKYLNNKGFDTDFHYQEVTLWITPIEKIII